MANIGKQWLWNILLAYVALAVMAVGSSSPCQQGWQQCQFRQIAEGQLPTMQPDLTVQGVSRAECSRLCLDLLGAGCDGISHQQERKECRVYSDRQARESMSTLAGYKFFDSCHALLDNPCSQNADCYPANTECRNGTCQDASQYQNSTENPVVVQGQVRLVDGGSPKRGRLEVFFDGVWGTVCDDVEDYKKIWHDNNAVVVCRQLGFLSGNPPQAVANRYGAGASKQPVHLDEVNCTGTELNIESCPRRPWGRHNCQHSEDVSVDCDPTA